MNVLPVSASARFGLKGRDAAAWLQHLGIAAPPRPNSVTRWHAHEALGSGRCLRQGSTEYLIELDTGSVPPPPPAAQFPNAWTLIRSDHSCVLNGAQWPLALSQVCSFDFERLHQDPDLVVMTLVAGIGVTLIREPATSHDTGLRLWCDASYSNYLQQCLQSIGGSR
jgi:sarcosine oxidase, subunit gamma